MSCDGVSHWRHSYAHALLLDGVLFGFYTCGTCDSTGTGDTKDTCDTTDTCDSTDTGDTKDTSHPQTQVTKVIRVSRFPLTDAHGSPVSTPKEFILNRSTKFGFLLAKYDDVNERRSLFLPGDFERSTIFDVEYSLLIDWCLQILPGIGHLVYLCSDEV